MSSSKIIVCITLSAELKKRIDDRIKRTKRSRSSEIEWILTEYLLREEESKAKGISIVR